jgi:hypothetical protein
MTFKTVFATSKHVLMYDVHWSNYFAIANEYKVVFGAKWFSLFHTFFNYTIMMMWKAYVIINAE